MRTGLVLGAGGVLGGAWLSGGLEALAHETGWDPARADHIVGTSAGSVLAALLAAGLSPASLSPDRCEQIFSSLLGEGAALPAGGWREAASRIRLPLPGSIGLCASGRGRPRAEMMLRLVLGLVPPGVRSGAPIRDTIARHAAGGPGPRTNCWIVACDYATGRRVAFGRRGSPDAELGEAVAASCAIPGYYEPQRIGGRLYVDGGLHSMSNADLLTGLELDLVVVMNPLSSHEEPPVWDPLGRLLGSYRRAAARQLEAEVARLRAHRTTVVVIEPDRSALAVMGHNLMNTTRRREVLAAARASVREQLARPELRSALRDLPRSRPLPRTRRLRPAA